MTELGFLWMLLPVAAASGWYMHKRTAGRVNVDRLNQFSSSYFRGLNYLLNEEQDKAVLRRILLQLAEALRIHFEQEESLYYESKKHDGTYPLIGVNTFLPKAGQEDEIHDLELIRSSESEKQDQIKHVREFQDNHGADGPEATIRLQEVARSRGNVFQELMETVKSSSLGQISGTLYEVGGEYRRNM